jgi:ferrochelatase
MATGKTAVLLLNVGTPDSPSVKDVRRYLSEFLNDPRVIDLPWLARKILVNLIIVPFRAPKSAKLYKLLWTQKGSPLLVHSLSVQDRLNEKVGSDLTFFVAMRYGNPSFREALRKVKEMGASRLILVPMFPHFASSSTGTALEAVLKIVKNWNVIPGIKVTGQFYNHPLFLDAFEKRIRSYSPEKYDHILFSYHGLPVSHISNIHPDQDCASCTCDRDFPAYGTFCYRATCYETTRLLAARLGLREGTYSHGFQSRLSDKWLKPFSDELLAQKAKEGVRKLLIVAPAFVADCLETTVELGVEYKKLFLENGGESLEYVESLNDLPEWIDALSEIITKD